MQVTPETDAFWAAAGEGRLVVERCGDCGAATAPPRGACRACGSRSAAPVEVPPHGHLWSWTVNHQPWFPGLEVPTVVAVVEPDGYPGVRLLGELRDADPDRTAIGMPLDITFEPTADGSPMLVVRPAALS